MEKTVFGRTGLEVTALGFGAAEIGYLGIDPRQASVLLNAVLDAGINVIDTAAAYPGSEELIAQAIGSRRGEFILVSKCGNSVPDVAAPQWSAELVGRTVDRSLRRLGTDHLDVMLLHSCDLETLRKGEALGALIKAREEGKVRHVGYSGDNQAAEWAAGQPEIAVVETSISICDQANIELVLPPARRGNTAVIAKRPLANAAWKDPSAQPGFYGKYASVYTDRLRRMGITPGDLGFSGPAEKAWPEIALRFVLSQKGVHTAIIGTTRLENLKANIAAAEKGPLVAEVVQALRAAFDKAEAESGTMWTGQM